MRSRNTATSLILAALLFAAGWVQAQTAGQVVNVSGPLFALKGDGGRRVLSVGSSIEQGDTLITEEKTYARVKFTDQGEITLRPGTQLKVESYAFTQETPKQDNVAFSLFKGALRSVTGLIGKRGNQDAYKLQTATATIGIRGTNFVAEFVPGADTDLAIYGPERQLALMAGRSLPLALAATGSLSDVPAGVLPPPALTEPFQLAQAARPPSGGLAPGLYVQVTDGIINLTNRGGSQSFSAGQFGYTPSFSQPPVVVPANPGIRFTPPPAFSRPPPAAPTPGSTPPPANQQEGCVVR